MSLRLRCSGALIAIAAASSLVFGAQKPGLDDILKSAADYLQTLGNSLGAVAADEEYTQRETTAGVVSRRLHADVVFVGSADGAVTVFRDVYAIDSRDVRARDDRLLKLFQGPPSAASQTRAEAIVEEGARYYLSPNLRVLDSPTLALEFLRQQNQAQSEFALDGVKTTDGVQVAAIKFKGRKEAAVLPLPEGLTTSGRFWIDVTTGTIRQTELTVSSKSLLIRINAKYANERSAGTWLPADVVQQVEISSSGSGGFSNMGAGGGMGARQSLEGRARYTRYRRASSS